ncbi:MAG TPA: hypothetical protein VN452_01675, partial [Longilinea sp.]|nr:hypothetical protein [Longilinea sp.]
IIDASIKSKFPGQKYFSMLAYHLSNQAGLGLSEQQIKNEVNISFQTDFDKTLQDILDCRYQFADGSIPCGLPADLLIAYGLRNFGAHQISSVQTIWKRFSEIRQALFNIFFLTVEALY